MRHHRTTAALTGLLLISLAGAADAGERQGRSPHHQTRGMIERLHDGGGHDHERSRHHDNHGGSQWQHSRHGRGDQHHGDHHNRHDRDLHWGHERWREGTDGHGHSLHGRGYWNDYHNAYRHHRHDYTATAFTITITTITTLPAFTSRNTALSHADTRMAGTARTGTLRISRPDSSSAP